MSCLFLNKSWNKTKVQMWMNNQDFPPALTADNTNDSKSHPSCPQLQFDRNNDSTKVSNDSTKVNNDSTKVSNDSTKVSNDSTKVNNVSTKVNNDSTEVNNDSTEEDSSTLVNNTVYNQTNDSHKNNRAVAKVTSSRLGKETTDDFLQCPDKCAKSRLDGKDIHPPGCKSLVSDYSICECKGLVTKDKQSRDSNRGWRSQIETGLSVSEQVNGGRSSTTLRQGSSISASRVVAAACFPLSRKDSVRCIKNVCLKTTTSSDFTDKGSKLLSFAFPHQQSGRDFYCSDQNIRAISETGSGERNDVINESRSTKVISSVTSKAVAASEYLKTISTISSKEGSNIVGNAVAGVLARATRKLNKEELFQKVNTETGELTQTDPCRRVRTNAVCKAYSRTTTRRADNLCQDRHSPHEVCDLIVNTLQWCKTNDLKYTRRTINNNPKRIVSFVGEKWFQCTERLRFKNKIVSSCNCPQINSVAEVREDSCNHDIDLLGLGNRNFLESHTHNKRSRSVSRVKAVRIRHTRSSILRQIQQLKNSEPTETSNNVSTQTSGVCFPSRRRRILHLASRALPAGNFQSYRKRGSSQNAQSEFLKKHKVLKDMAEQRFVSRPNTLSKLQKDRIIAAAKPSLDPDRSAESVLAVLKDDTEANAENEASDNRPIEKAKGVSKTTGRFCTTAKVAMTMGFLRQTQSQLLKMKSVRASKAPSMGGSDAPHIQQKNGDGKVGHPSNVSENSKKKPQATQERGLTSDTSVAANEKAGENIHVMSPLLRRASRKENICLDSPARIRSPRNRRKLGMTYSAEVLSPLTSPTQSESDGTSPTHTDNDLTSTRKEFTLDSCNKINITSKSSEEICGASQSKSRQTESPSPLATISTFMTNTCRSDNRKSPSPRPKEISLNSSERIKTPEEPTETILLGTKTSSLKPLSSNLIKPSSVTPTALSPKNTSLTSHYKTSSSSSLSSQSTKPSKDISIQLHRTTHNKSPSLLPVIKRQNAKPNNSQSGRPQTIKPSSTELHSASTRLADHHQQRSTMTTELNSKIDNNKSCESLRNTASSKKMSEVGGLNVNEHTYEHIHPAQQHKTTVTNLLIDTAGHVTSGEERRRTITSHEQEKLMGEPTMSCLQKENALLQDQGWSSCRETIDSSKTVYGINHELLEKEPTISGEHLAVSPCDEHYKKVIFEGDITGSAKLKSSLIDVREGQDGSDSKNIDHKNGLKSQKNIKEHENIRVKEKSRHSLGKQTSSTLIAGCKKGDLRIELRAVAKPKCQEAQTQQITRTLGTSRLAGETKAKDAKHISLDTSKQQAPDKSVPMKVIPCKLQREVKIKITNVQMPGSSLRSIDGKTARETGIRNTATKKLQNSREVSHRKQLGGSLDIRSMSSTRESSVDSRFDDDTASVTSELSVASSVSSRGQTRLPGKTLLTKRGGKSNSGTTLTLTPVQTSKATAAVPTLKNSISKQSHCVDNRRIEKPRVLNSTHVLIKGGKSVLSAKRNAPVKGNPGVRETTQAEASKREKETVAGKEKESTTQSLKTESLPQDAAGDCSVITVPDSRTHRLVHSQIEDVTGDRNQTRNMREIMITGDGAWSLIGSIDEEINDRVITSGKLETDDDDRTRRQDQFPTPESDEKVTFGLECVNIPDNNTYICDRNTLNGRMNTLDVNDPLEESDSVSVALTSVSGSDSAFVGKLQPDAREGLSTRVLGVSGVDTSALVAVQITTSSRAGIARQTGGRQPAKWGHGVSKLAGSSRVTPGEREIVPSSNVSDTREKVKHHSSAQRKETCQDKDEDQLGSGETDNQSRTLAGCVAFSSSSCAHVDSSCGSNQISGRSSVEDVDLSSRVHIVNPVIWSDNCDMKTQNDVISCDDGVTTHHVVSSDGCDVGISVYNRHVTPVNVISSDCQISKTHNYVISSDTHDTEAQNVISLNNQYVSTDSDVISAPNHDVKTARDVRCTLSTDSNVTSSETKSPSEAKRTKPNLPIATPQENNPVHLPNLISKTQHDVELSSSAETLQPHSFKSLDAPPQPTNASASNWLPASNRGVNPTDPCVSNKVDKKISPCLSGDESYTSIADEGCGAAIVVNDEHNDSVMPNSDEYIQDVMPITDKGIGKIMPVNNGNKTDNLPVSGGHVDKSVVVNEGCTTESNFTDNGICNMLTKGDNIKDVLPSHKDDIKDIMFINDKGMRDSVPVVHESMKDVMPVDDVGRKDVMSLNGDNISDAMVFSGDNISDAMVCSGDNISDAMVCSGDNISDAMASSGDNISDAMVCSGDNISDAMVCSGDNISDAMVFSGDNISDAMVCSGDNITDAMVCSGDNITDAMVCSGDNVNDMPLSGEHSSDVVTFSGEYMNYFLPVSAENISDMLSSDDSINSTRPASEEEDGNFNSLQRRYHNGEIIGYKSPEVGNITSDVINPHSPGNHTRFLEENKSLPNTSNLEMARIGLADPTQGELLHFRRNETTSFSAISLDVDDSLATFFQDEEEEEGSVHEYANDSQNGNEETDSDNTDICFVRGALTFSRGTRGSCYEMSHMSKSLSDSSDGRQGDIVSYGTPPSSNSDVREGGKEETAEDLADGIRAGCGMERLRHKTLAEISINGSLYTSALENVKHRHSGYEMSSICDDDIVDDYVKNMDSVLDMDEVTADDVDDVSSDNDAESMASSESSFQSATSDIIMATVSASTRELVLFEGLGTSKAGEGMAKLMASDSLNLDASCWEETKQTSNGETVLHKQNVNNENFEGDKINTRSMLLTSTPRIPKHERRNSTTTFNNKTAVFVTPKRSVSQTFPDCSYQATNTMLPRSTRSLSRSRADSEQVCHEEHSTLGTVRVATTSLKDVDKHLVIRRDRSLHKARIPRALSCPNVQPKMLYPQVSNVGHVTYSKRHSSYLPTSKVTNSKIDVEEAATSAAEFHSASGTNLKPTSIGFSPSETIDRKSRQKRLQENKVVSHLPVRAQPVDPIISMQSFMPVARGSRSPLDVPMSVNIDLCTSPQPQQNLDQKQTQQFKSPTSRPGNYPFQIPCLLRKSDTDIEIKRCWAKTDISAKYSRGNHVKTNLRESSSDVNCQLAGDEELLGNSVNDIQYDSLPQSLPLSKDRQEDHISSAINKSNFSKKKHQGNHKTRMARDPGATIAKQQGKRLGEGQRLESSDSLHLQAFIETENNHGDKCTPDTSSSHLIKEHESTELGTQYNKIIKTDLRHKTKLEETVTSKDKETRLTCKDEKRIAQSNNMASSNEILAARVCPDLQNSTSELVSYHWSEQAHPSARDSWKACDSDILEVELVPGNSNIFGLRSEELCLHQEQAQSETHDIRSSLFESGYSSDIKSPDVRSPVQDIENAHRHPDQIIPHEVDFNQSNKPEACAAVSVFTGVPDVRMSGQGSSGRKIPVLYKRESRGDNLKPGVSACSDADGEKLERLNTINTSGGAHKDVQVEQENIASLQAEELGNDEHLVINEAEYSGNAQTQLPSCFLSRIETSEEPWADVNKASVARGQVSHSLTCLHVDTGHSGSPAVCQSATPGGTGHQGDTDFNVEKTRACIEHTEYLQAIELGTHKGQLDRLPELTRTHDSGVNMTSTVKACDSTHDVSKLRDAITSLEFVGTVNEVYNQRSGNSQEITQVEINGIRTVPIPLDDSPRASKSECCLTHSSEEHTCICRMELSKQQFTSVLMDLGQNTDPLECGDSHPCSVQVPEYIPTGGEFAAGSRDGYSILASCSSSENGTPLTAETAVGYLGKTDKDREAIATSLYNNEDSQASRESARSHVHSTCDSCSDCQEGVRSKVLADISRSARILTRGADVFIEESTSSTGCELQGIKTAANDFVLDSSFEENIGAVEENKCLNCSEIDNTSRVSSTDSLSSKDCNNIDKLRPEVRLDATSLCQTSSSPLSSVASTSDVSIAGDALRLGICSVCATQPADGALIFEDELSHPCSFQYCCLPLERIPESGPACLQTLELNEHESPSSCCNASTSLNVVSDPSTNADNREMTSDDNKIENETGISQTGVHRQSNIADITSNVNSYQGSWTGSTGVNVNKMETTSSHAPFSPPQIRKLLIPGDSHNVWSKGDHSGTQTPRRISSSPQTDGPPREKSPLILEIVCELLSKVAASEHRASSRTKPLTPQNEASRLDLPTTSNLTPQEKASGARVINKWKSMVKKSRVVAIRESLTIKLAANESSSSHLPPAVSPTPARKYKWDRSEAGIWMKIYLDDSSKDAKQENHEVSQEIYPGQNFDAFLSPTNSHDPSGTDITQHDCDINGTGRGGARPAAPEEGFNASEKLSLLDSSGGSNSKHNTDSERNDTSSICPGDYDDNKDINEEEMTDDENASDIRAGSKRSSKETGVNNSDEIHQDTTQLEEQSSILFNSKLSEHTRQKKRVEVTQNEANSNISISYTQAADVANCFPKSCHVIESRHIDPCSRQIDGSENSDKGNVTDNQTVNRASAGVELSARDNVVTGSLSPLRVEQCTVVTSVNSQYKSDISQGSMRAMCGCERSVGLCFCSSSTTEDNCIRSLKEVSTTDPTSQRSLAKEVWDDQTLYRISPETCSFPDKPSCCRAESSFEPNGPADLLLTSHITETVHSGLDQDFRDAPGDFSTDMSTRPSSHSCSVEDNININVKITHELDKDSYITTSLGECTSTESQNNATRGEFSNTDGLQSFEDVIESTCARKTVTETSSNQQCKTRTYKYAAVSGDINVSNKIKATKSTFDENTVSGKSMSLNDVSFTEGLSVNKETTWEAKSLTVLDQNKYDDSCNSGTQSGISPNEEVITQGEGLSLKPESSFVRKPRLATGQGECLLDASSRDDITDQTCLGNDVEEKSLSTEHSNLPPAQLHQTQPGNADPKEADSGVKKTKKYSWPTVAESLKRFQKSIAENSHRSSHLQRGREQQFLKSSTKAYLASQNVKKINSDPSTKHEISGNSRPAAKDIGQTITSENVSARDDSAAIGLEYPRCSKTSTGVQMLTGDHSCHSTTKTSLSVTDTLLSSPLSSLTTLKATDVTTICPVTDQRSQPEPLTPSKQNDPVMDSATPNTGEYQDYNNANWSPSLTSGQMLPISPVDTVPTEVAAIYKSLNFQSSNLVKKTGQTSANISLASEVFSNHDNQWLSDLSQADSAMVVSETTLLKLEPARSLGQPQWQGQRLLSSRSAQDDEQNPGQELGLSESSRATSDNGEFYPVSSNVSPFSSLHEQANTTLAINSTSAQDTSSTMDTTTAVATTSTIDTQSTIDTSTVDSSSILEQTDMQSPRAAGRRHMSSAKLISVSVWDTHDGDKTGRHSRRLWPPEELPTLAGISEIEEAQSNQDSSPVNDTDLDLQDSTLLQTRDGCKERVRASRSPVRPQSKQRKAQRRSLSLPTGGLSYGDVKILYKDGHFVMVDTSTSKGVKATSETTGKLEGVSEENERADPSASVHSADSASSGKDESEDSGDIESKVRAEILSLLERGISDPQGMQTDTWDSVEARRTKTGVPLFLTLPRRTARHGQRPVSVDEARLLKYYSKSQQSLISQAEMDRRREEGQESRRISHLKRHNTFTETRYSSVMWNDGHSSVDNGTGTDKTEFYDAVFDDSHHQPAAEESQNSKSRSKGPGFFQRMLLKRRGSGSDKSLSSSTKLQQKNDLSSSSVSLASVSSTSQQHQALSKRDNRDTSIGRKMSFRGIFKRKNSTDESGRKTSTDESCSPSVVGGNSLADPSVPLHRCSSQDTGDSDQCSNGLVAAEVDDTFSHFQFRSRSPRTPLSNCSSQSSLYCSLSQDDSDCTRVAFQADGISHHTRGPSGRFRNRTTVTSGERSSGDSFSEYDLSSADLQNSDGTLTPRSLSPSAADSSLDNDRTLLASPTGSNRLSPPVHQKLTTSPLSARRRRSKEEDMSQKSSSSCNEGTSSRSVEMVSRNSNDSGIQNDGNVNSSAESIQTTVKLRKSKSPSPSTDRPKSDTTVRWADLLEEVMESGAVRYRQDAAKLRKQPRPRSDIGGFRTDSRHAILVNTNSFGCINSSTTVPTPGSTSHAMHISTACSASDMRVLMQSRESLLSLVELRQSRRGTRDPMSSRLAKNRRLSTPQPITLRTEKPTTRPTGTARISSVLTHSHSMPDSLDKLTRKNYFSQIGSDAQSITSQQSVDEDSSDESEYSMGYHTEVSHSTRSSHVMLAALDHMIGNENLTYAEALWDHVTMDPDELGFRAGDLIRVTDTSDKHWWFGSIDDHEGWFPATFVRLRVNQDVMEEELAYFLAEEEEAPLAAEHAGAIAKSSNFMGKTQARSNVVNEIIGAEREYVKHLRDVVEGYVKQARKRPEMFPKEKVNTIFSNIEDIFKFATALLDQLELSVNHSQPHLSELGQCFLDKVEGFELYSDYCNNHTAACEELRELYRNKRYRHFFEACRLLQEMIEIPLEGFLLTPVQKICKYHLQLAELLKFTPSDHPDFGQVQRALEAMKKMAMLVNERKRKMESVEKLAAWQLLVDDWEGPDILEGSSELIYSGELNKINHAGWSQERYFFLFDHQLVYCKKDLLKKSSFCFKGRINMDSCQVINVADGRDPQYNVSVRNAWKLHDTSSDKWYLLVAKTTVIKQRWLKAFQDERRRVQDDLENNFNIPNHVKQAVITNFKQKTNLSKPRGKGKFSRSKSATQVISTFNRVSAIATLPRNKNHHKVKCDGSLDKSKKTNWFFLGKGKS